MPATRPPTVTAAQLVRHFSVIRQRATTAPVTITNHGRESHVLCAIEQFRALSSRNDDASTVAIDIAQLAAWIDQGLILIDAAGRVLHANAALLALAPYDPARLIGHDIFEAMPEWAGTLAEAYLRRAIGARATALFEMASPFHPDTWLQCRLAPVGERIALLLRDVSREVRGVRGAHAGEALLRALDRNDHVAVVRLSPSGAIEAIQGRFAALVGLPDSRLIGVRFADLIDSPYRLAVINACEGVIARDDGDTVAARLLARSGASVPVHIGMARAGEGRRVEGATLVVSLTAAADVPEPAPRALRRVDS